MMCTRTGGSGVVACNVSCAYAKLQPRGQRFFFFLFFPLHSQHQQRLRHPTGETNPRLRDPKLS